LLRQRHDAGVCFGPDGGMPPLQRGHHGYYDTVAMTLITAKAVAPKEEDVPRLEPGRELEQSLMSR
jgi:hypothetical protein